MESIIESEKTEKIKTSNNFVQNYKSDVSFDLTKFFLKEIIKKKIVVYL